MSTETCCDFFEDLVAPHTGTIVPYCAVIAPNNAVRTITAQFTQGTPEWLEMRRRYIMASDAPTIMGVSPYKTQYQLWTEKVYGATQQENSAMRYGKMMEERALLAYEEYTNSSMAPAIVYHDQIVHMGASLDGLSIDGTIAVEIKNCCSEDHEKARSGEIPPKYWPQLQHQLACLGHDHLHYWSYHKGEGLLVVVKKDEDYVKQLYIAESKFWIDNVLGQVEPERDDKDYIECVSPEWVDLAETLMNIKYQMKILEESEETCKARLKVLAKGKNTKGAGVKITRGYVRGLIDYKNIPELANVDLEKHRKKHTERWTITLEKST